MRMRRIHGFRYRFRFRLRLWLHSGALSTLLSPRARVDVHEILTAKDFISLRFVSFHFVFIFDFVSFVLCRTAESSWPLSRTLSRIASRRLWPKVSLFHSALAQPCLSFVPPHQFALLYFFFFLISTLSGVY